MDWFALVDVGAISSQSSSRACMSLYCSACRRVIDREGRAATLALNEITYMEEIGKVLEENIRLIWYKQLHKQLKHCCINYYDYL